MKVGLGRFLTALLVIGVALSCVFPSTAEARKKRSTKAYRVSARSAVLVEDGYWTKTLYEKDAARPVLPASTTKIMTALIVMERLGLDSYVTVGSRAVNVLPSKIDIKPGERYRVRDLLYAILLNSANDASIALAEAVAGSEEKFVDLMNARAKKLGAKKTLFANSHGLPSDDPQYTTAHDMVLMLREALKKEVFRGIIQKRVMIIKSEAGRTISLRSHNKALFLKWKRDVYGKTGYTNAARSCFVGYIDSKKRRVFIAVFGCSRRWDDVKYILERRGGVDL